MLDTGLFEHVRDPKPLDLEYFASPFKGQILQFLGYASCS